MNRCNYKGQLTRSKMSMGWGGVENDSGDKNSDEVEDTEEVKNEEDVLEEDGWG